MQWGGLILTLLLLVGTWASAKRYVLFAHPSGWRFTAWGGVVHFHRNNDPVPLPGGGLWEVGRAPKRYWWWFDFRPGRARQVPIWSVAALCAVPTAAAWRCAFIARRRARADRCPTCSYPRAGLAAGARCPECGAAPAGAKS